MCFIWLGIVSLGSKIEINWNNTQNTTDYLDWNILRLGFVNCTCLFRMVGEQ